MTLLRLKGEATRSGTCKCRSCRTQFTVTVGTILEGPHVGLQKWFLVIYLMGASRKGMSAHQIYRSLGVTYQTAWFMCHRVREAMRARASRGFLSRTVEADEAYVGRKTKGGERGRGAPNRTIVFGMVQRAGNVRPVSVPDVKKVTLHPNIKGAVVKGSRLITGELYTYHGLGSGFENGAVQHSAREYVAPKDIHANTQESFWALLKRGVLRTSHYISKPTMGWYCGEFGFPYNTREVTDGERFTGALTNCDGRLRSYFKAEGFSVDVA